MKYFFILIYYKNIFQSALMFCDAINTGLLPGEPNCQKYFSAALSNGVSPEEFFYFNVCSQSYNIIHELLIVVISGF